MSVLEYARAHGIATDYITAFEPLAVIQDLQRKHDTDLIQDRHLTQLNLPECSFHERLTVDKDAAMVLAAVSMIGTKTKEMEDILSSQLDFQSAKKFRVELPLLKSDHEHDCNAYTKRRQIRLEEIHLPPEILDKEKDESIEWSQQALSLPASMLQKMEHETLVVSKTTLGDLVHYLNDDWNNEDEGAIRDLALPYKRVSARATQRLELTTRRTNVLYRLRHHFLHVEVHKNHIYHRLPRQRFHCYRIPQLYSAMISMLRTVRYSIKRG